MPQGAAPPPKATDVIVRNKSDEPVPVEVTRSVHTIEEQRQYQYMFNDNLSDAVMNDLGKHNWEAVCTMERDGKYGILYKKTI